MDLKEKLNNLKSKIENKSEQEVQKSYMPEGRYTSMPVSDKNLISKLDDLYIVSKMLGKKPEELEMFSEIKAYTEVAKALTTAVGADWIPRELSDELVQALEYELVVANLHKTLKVNTSPYEIPILKRGGFIGAIKEEATTINETVSLTDRIGKGTFSLKNLAARIDISYEMAEDSVIPMLPLVKDLITKSLALSIELATLDGDTANTHMDADVTDAKDPRKLWDGYRKIALTYDLTVNAGGEFTIGTVRDMLKLMGAYGVRKEDVALIVSPSTYISMLTWPELLTVDKYGPNATVLKGEVARVFNIPVVVSGYIREDLNSSGVYSTSGNKYTVAYLVYKPGFVYATKGNITLETDKDISSQVQVLVASRRLDFKQIYAQGEPVVVMAHNIAV